MALTGGRAAVLAPRGGGSSSSVRGVRGNLGRLVSRSRGKCGPTAMAGVPWGRAPGKAKPEDDTNIPKAGDTGVKIPIMLNNTPHPREVRCDVTVSTQPNNIEVVLVWGVFIVRRARPTSAHRGEDADARRRRGASRR